MNWLDKYREKQKQKEELFMKSLSQKENNYYTIPDKYLTHPIFEEINEDIQGKISKEIGEELEQLFDENYIICIHRTELDLETYKNQIDDVFNNGLMNAGGPYHGFTLTPLSNLPFLISISKS